MYNADDLVKAIKKAAHDTMDASKLGDVAFGTVLSSAPLRIKIDQKLVLSSAQLVLTRNVTDYKVDMTVDHLTEDRAGGGGEAAFASHNHAYRGRKTFLVHNALKAGEDVLLIRQAGGQKYVVIDRLE